MTFEDVVITIIQGAHYMMAGGFNNRTCLPFKRGPRNITIWNNINSNGTHNGIVWMADRDNILTVENYYRRINRIN